MLFTLCNTEEIPDPGSMGFEIKLGEFEASLFVVHREAQFHAFNNSCPHTGVNLEWQENVFLDMENTYIQCSMHDALFEITTGKCVSGPCTGDSLVPVKLTIRNSKILAELPV